MKYFLSFIVFIYPAIVFCQTIERQLFSNAAINYTGADFNLTSSIGETVISTESSGSIVLTQGFQQPDSTSITVGNKNMNVTLKYRLYPNPTANISWLDINVDRPTSITINIYDLQGKEIFESKSISVNNNHTEKLDLSQLVNAQYILNIEAFGKKVKTINIQKID